MIDFDKRDLVLSVINNNPLREGKISDEDFIEKYTRLNKAISQKIKEELENSLLKKNAFTLELTLYVGFHFSFSIDDEEILVLILNGSWHQKHDEVLRALVKIKACSNSAVDSIYYCAINNFDYLEDDKDDGIYTLSSNCIYALAKIGTEYAVEKLYLLSKNGQQEISKKAKEVMEYYNLN